MLWSVFWPLLLFEFLVDSKFTLFNYSLRIPDTRCPNNKTVHLLHNPVHHWFIKEKCGHVIKHGCQLNFFSSTLSYNSVHFIPCDLVFLLCPLMYGLVCSDSVWYLWVKNSENMQLLDVLVCNFVNKPSFPNPTKRPFSRFWKDDILAKLQVKMSRSCRFLLFLPYKYQVSLNLILTEFSNFNILYSNI